MEEKNFVWRKSYTAMYKLEVVDFAKEKGNREAVRKFNVGETSVPGNGGKKKRPCLHQKKRAMKLLW
jgi:hypothetical protein